MSAGMRIVTRGNVDDASPDDTLVDTTLETLPIHKQVPWEITTIGPDLSGNFATTYTRIPHTLGFQPLFKVWVDVVETVSGKPKTRKYFLPYFAANNFIYSATSDKDYLIIRSDFAAPDYPGATFRVTGYAYIFDKKVQIP